MRMIRPMTATITASTMRTRFRGTPSGSPCSQTPNRHRAAAQGNLGQATSPWPPSPAGIGRPAALTPPVAPAQTARAAILPRQRGAIMASLFPAGEHHYVHRIGWLRATVLGANDGTPSTPGPRLGAAAPPPAPR